MVPTTAEERVKLGTRHCAARLKYGCPSVRLARRHPATFNTCAAGLLRPQCGHVVNEFAPADDHSSDAEKLDNTPATSTGALSRILKPAIWFMWTRRWTSKRQGWRLRKTIPRVQAWMRRIWCSPVSCMLSMASERHPFHCNDCAPSSSLNPSLSGPAGGAMVANERMHARKVRPSCHSRSSTASEFTPVMQAKLHSAVDMDCFYAACELRERPSLRTAGRCGGARTRG